MERLRSWLLTDSPESAFHARCQRFYLGWRAFRANPIAVIGLLIITTLVLVAVLAPFLTRGDGTEQVLSDRLMAPGAEHWFGTDELGRDIYERIVWASAISSASGRFASAIGECALCMIARSAIRSGSPVRPAVPS